MKHLLLLTLLLCACTDGSVEPGEYRSGHYCTCEQRTQVGEYVARNQTNGISDDSDYYLNNLFEIAVKTICDNRDSVRVVSGTQGRIAVGMKPCEAWFDNLRGIR